MTGFFVEWNFTFFLPFFIHWAIISSTKSFLLLFSRSSSFRLYMNTTSWSPVGASHGMHPTPFTLSLWAIGHLRKTLSFTFDMSLSHSATPVRNTRPIIPLPAASFQLLLSHDHLRRVSSLTVSAMLTTSPVFPSIAHSSIPSKSSRVMSPGANRSKLVLFLRRVRQDTSESKLARFSMSRRHPTDDVDGAAPILPAKDGSPAEGPRNPDPPAPGVPTVTSFAAGPKMPWVTEMVGGGPKIPVE
mmetsp:Transcript_21930/g.42586  ORF Transcript_21930/g.42586 Transcript_21930/m.42586 type:complete len:244 (-) Transcript_21930:477-1208(-)